MTLDNGFRSLFIFLVPAIIIGYTSIIVNVAQEENIYCEIFLPLLTFFKLITEHLGRQSLRHVEAYYERPHSPNL
jgi:hypothetical protein